MHLLSTKFFFSYYVIIFRLWVHGYEKIRTRLWKHLLTTNLLYEPEISNYFDDTEESFRRGINFVPCNFINGWRQRPSASRITSRRFFSQEPAASKSDTDLVDLGREASRNSPAVKSQFARRLCSQIADPEVWEAWNREGGAWRHLMPCYSSSTCVFTLLHLCSRPL